MLQIAAGLARVKRDLSLLADDESRRSEVLEKQRGECSDSFAISEERVPVSTVFRPCQALSRRTQAREKRMVPADRSDLLKDPAFLVDSLEELARRGHVL